MKTVFRENYGPVSSLEIHEVDIPKPKSNEILVKVKASTVNRTDEGVLLGKPFIFRFFVGFPKPRVAATGTDFSGVVMGFGSKVKNLKIEDEIYGFLDNNLGSHSEYVCISANTPFLKKPTNISHEQAAAALEGAHYAYYFLEKAQLKIGDKIMVNGATGAIGNAAIQMLIHKGYEVSFTYPTDSYEKIEHLKAVKKIDYLREDFTKQDSQYDFVFDAVGKSTFGACKAILKPGGVYISSELGPNAENIPLSIYGLFHKSKRVVFPFPGSPKYSMPVIRKMLEDGSFVPLIEKVYKFEEIKDAFNHMLSGQKRGNLVLKIND
jgi:NADPH:quinone reductase-like Zn-dependent oxidoreductase